MIPCPLIGSHLTPKKQKSFIFSCLPLEKRTFRVYTILRCEVCVLFVLSAKNV